MAIAVTLRLALAFVSADRVLLAESGITLPRWLLVLGVPSLMASFTGLMALNAYFDASPTVVHVQRVVSRATRLFFRAGGDTNHDPLVVESWHAPGELREVVVPAALWRKARVMRSCLQIETRHGGLGDEYLTRDPVLVAGP